uniref:Uncharacterized protein n=1 Tax=Anguilla anguilla TaxID=7936 RepID=A0A0E9WN43_ANGAN
MDISHVQYLISCMHRIPTNCMLLKFEHDCPPTLPVIRVLTSFELCPPLLGDNSICRLISVSDSITIDFY